MDVTNPQTHWINASVADAFEGKSYGEYSWQSVAHKNARDVPPVECYVVDRMGASRHCNSDVEFNELIKAYMADL